MNELMLNVLQMNSREIAELVESRHTDVKRSIERLVERGAIQQPPTAFSEEINNLGFAVKREYYIFTGEQGKRDSIVVVAQLSPEFTARLVDRWQELESKIINHQPPQSDKYDPLRIASLAMQAALAFGFTGNQAVLSADNAVRYFTGTSLLEAMGQRALIAPDQEQLLTVSDIGLRIGYKAREVNKRLIAAGLQIDLRDHKDRLYYELTTLGHSFGVYLDTGKRHSNSTPVRQIKWRASVIDLVGQVQGEFN